MRPHLGQVYFMALCLLASKSGPKSNVISQLEVGAFDESTSDFTLDDSKMQCVVNSICRLVIQMSGPK